jgi:membrane-associated phospholipid phosphatase
VDLAVAIVAAVAFARPLWAIPFAVLGALVEWARVGTGIHHPIDVLGSDALILVGAVIALLVAPIVTQVLLPYVPARVLDPVAAQEEEQLQRTG